ncbi:hypothetical protein NCC49_003124 [Naganishia albida]|nr:hypothetical protein NCC49_003124 [Naganishia albida]
MAQINDFADLFNLEDLNTFDKEDCSTPTPNLSPKHAGIGSGSPPAAKNANFLVKLYMVLQEEPPLTAIYWSADGKQLVVASPGLLEKEILPKYWKHNKFASFGRQLNIYGFSRVYPGHKFKDENGNIKDDASVWSHPTLHRESTLEDIMAIKRRAAPKLFRTRKLANGQVVQIRTGGAAVDAKLNSLRMEKPYRFGRQASSAPYHLSPFQHTPTFYHSSDARFAQDFAPLGSPQWAFGSHASPALEPAHLLVGNGYSHQIANQSNAPNRYVSETVMSSLQANAAADSENSAGSKMDASKPISPIDIIQAIPDAQYSSPGNAWWLKGDGRTGIPAHEFQPALQTQGMPPLSWTTPSSPTGVFPFGERWNGSDPQAMQGSTGVFTRDLGHHTAPASPRQAHKQMQANNSVGYPMTPQDVNFAPGDFQLLTKPAADAPMESTDQAYLFSQLQHTVPFSAVAETSKPMYEHVDLAVPATADVYLGANENDRFAQDIWPINVMNTMTTRPLPVPSDSVEMVHNREAPMALPYATTYRYTAPTGPACIL